MRVVPVTLPVSVTHTNEASCTAMTPTALLNPNPPLITQLETSLVFRFSRKSNYAQEREQCHARQSARGVCGREARPLSACLLHGSPKERPRKISLIFVCAYPQGRPLRKIDDPPFLRREDLGSPCRTFLKKVRSIFA